ncbi:M14 family metallopeptidase [Robiginitalea sp. M366]|uniref:M14 family metallopeptidase n=1 Tax=Robiginitalea aestuariiviva TaxID=3036903 RepID=UPI00240D3B8C|nr:M14 family metallopeptidase [Robiginitalea aestuariiviva]MDG1572398.1 M14 family metallopeptidase [Robiginitalea aestuariiviva]
MRTTLLSAILALAAVQAFCQDYFLKQYEPYRTDIPSPETFLGYGIGEYHTRHDRIVHYLQTLAERSDRAEIEVYGYTHEKRPLVILRISSPEHLAALPELRERHLAFTDPATPFRADPDLPVFVNLGYNVHGNEPSSSEAAMLAAYILVASEHPRIARHREQAVVFVDPTINPDGRDRHTQWANSYRGTPPVADAQDAEHNEYFPGGRTNHYWFDLNRDWLLAINPESRGKLNWYHQWYPNVVTDFHEMGTQSTHFFEPMKANGSLNPIMPKENYVDLNNQFAEYFSEALDSIGSLYFTKEVFDGTYPGYGSSYPDLQGGLGLLFEQASSRGHVQNTAYGQITFAFTIRNQLVSTMATVKAAVENKDYLRRYQKNFFTSALRNAAASRVGAYRLRPGKDANRMKALLDKLLIHRVEVRKTAQGEFVIPTSQPHYRMVQTFFETYRRYRDSVFYDASAWSVANFYNIPYQTLRSAPAGEEISSLEGLFPVEPVAPSEYAYLIDWNDYNAPALLHRLQTLGLTLASAFKPFTTQVNGKAQSFDAGTLVLPVQPQGKPAAEIHKILLEAQQEFQVPAYAVVSGYHLKGVDLGSRYTQPIRRPKAAMLIGEGVRSYEAGEVWHLLDTRVGMPITKIPLRDLDGARLDGYNTLVLVSGRYNFSEAQEKKLREWVGRGNTLIAIAGGAAHAIRKGWVSEILLEAEKDSTAPAGRLPYADAPENLGREEVGGVILEADLDLTHPLAFGYSRKQIPVYKNNTVWLAPSKNPYATVAQYTQSPHVDGYISPENLNDFARKSASLLVSPMGRGRVVLFADNPNFRGSWYGTNRLFLNALFLGNHIEVPD